MTVWGYLHLSARGTPRSTPFKYWLLGVLFGWLWILMDNRENKKPSIFWALRTFWDVVVLDVWRTREDSNLWPLPPEGNALSS